MKNIISTSTIQEHSVEKYRFKILGGTNIAQEEIKEPEKYVQKDSVEIFKEELPLENTIVQKKEEEINNKFVEELLKKSDELSSNIIKLQMQIEKQEAEFERRLQSELKREADASFEKGYQQAKKEIESSANEVKTKYLNAVGNLEKEVKKSSEYLKKIETELSSTAVEIAKEVIAKEVSNSSSKVAIALSKELINELKDGKKIELKVNPKDYEDIKQEYAELENIRVSADDAISLGGVIVFSDVGNLDGNLLTRLQKVKNLIQNS
jgi:flagellar assembly protein FliH